MQQLPDDLDTEQHRQVSQLLHEYRDIFSTSAYDMGRTGLVEHEINTGDHRPVRQGLRRHPIAHLDIIDKQVREMVRHDLVEPAASPWAANVVLVRKKDGTHRLCVDYRALNAVTYKDTYPLPHIDTCLGSMDGASWFSTLDLRSGYHNIPIRQQDRDKTAFITRRGCFRYKVLPFGLTTAPSVFQRLMDLVLCGLTYVSCLVYIDDIIVFAKDFRTHLDRLAEVFERLRQAGLKLHITKCSLFRRRVSFLGHVLSGSGIEVQPDKVRAVQDWPTPRNVSELRSFLGLASYYRRFVSGFADIAAPLNKLLRKNSVFEWSADQSRAFLELKDRLTSAPILGMPADTGTFLLDTDASNVGLGAVLSQMQGDREVVIAYASRSLSNAEQRYDTTKKELLAVMFGLKAYRQYLLGRKFTVRTDHSALQWLRKTPEPMAQMARWLSYIEQFDFDIKHRAGTRHGNADGLSRVPVQEHQNVARAAKHRSNGVQSTDDGQRGDIEITDGDTPPREGPDVEREALTKAQMEDPDIGPALRLIMHSPEAPDISQLTPETPGVKRFVAEWFRLKLIDGVLYRLKPATGDRPEQMQLVVPASMRQDFMRQAHTGMTGGHYGSRRTQAQVQRRGYWHGWRKDVKRFCRRCDNCNRYFRGQLPRTAPLQPQVTGAPFERMHADITGPHPRSRRGSVYILTCVDPFTKWAEAFAIPNKEATTVARVLVEQVFCRMGVPIALVTDRGKEMDGNLMREVCRLMGVDKMRTTAYKASTNAAVERFHRTLNSLIGRTIEENQKDWDSLLPYVMAAYRSSEHDATKYSPNYLVFGRENRSPADLVYGTPPASTPATFDDFAHEMEVRMQQAYALVREHLGVAAQRNKHSYDLRVRPAQFKVGDWVLYFNPRKHRGKQDKWRRKFAGPYLVVSVPGPVNVTLQLNAKTKPFLAHIDKVKLYCADVMPKSWLKQEISLAEGPGLNSESLIDTAPGEGALFSDLSRCDPDSAELEGGPIVPEWPPPVVYRSPRPQRTRQVPARYRD